MTFRLFVDRSFRAVAARRPARRRNRVHRLEKFEDRRLLVAEGTPFNLTQTVQTAGLAGALTSTIRWGDGTQTVGSVTALPATGPLRMRFDFSLDVGPNRFFDTQQKRDLLQLAGDTLTLRLNDDLAAISPSGTNTWVAVFLDPVTGQSMTRSNLQIAANELLVFAGGRDLPGRTRGLAGPGGFGASGTTEFVNIVTGRGEAGALSNPQTDFGPWGGSAAFDNADTDWYFGTDPNGMQSGQVDFLTVATHELAHVLGFGFIPPVTTPPQRVSAWQNLSSTGSFTGPKSIAAARTTGSVPLATGDRAHWQEGILADGRPSLMDPTIATGTRTFLNALDFAGLDDIGWDVDSTVVTVTGSHTFADNATYPIEVIVSGTAGSITSTTSAVITNVAPTLVVPGEQTIVLGQPLSLPNIGQITDPGFSRPGATPPTAETFTYSIDWGDSSSLDTGTATIDRVGSATQTTLASFDGSHTYAAVGTYTIRVTARDDDNGADTETIRVNVIAPPVLSLTLNRTTIAEDAGASAAMLTITRSGPSRTTPQTITLRSSDTSEATVPASVVIPAGETFVTVPVNAVDDALLDGGQIVELTASGTGVEPGSIDITVTDRETITASFNVASIREGAVDGALLLTISRSNTDVVGPLSVRIDGLNASQLVLASTILIPAAQQSVVVPVPIINNDLPEVTESLSLTFAATGYASATARLDILDDEPPKFQNQADRFDVDGSGLVTAGDALAVINALNIRGDNPNLNPVTDDPRGIFVDVTGDYRVTALDALEIINQLNIRQNQPTSESEFLPGTRNSAPEAYDSALIRLLEEDERRRRSQPRSA